MLACGMYLFLQGDHNGSIIIFLSVIFFEGDFTQAYFRVICKTKQKP